MYAPFFFLSAFCFGLLSQLYVSTRVKLNAIIPLDTLPRVAFVLIRFAHLRNARIRADKKDMRAKLKNKKRTFLLRFIWVAFGSNQWAAGVECVSTVQCVHCACVLRALCLI